MRAMPMVVLLTLLWTPSAVGQQAPRLTPEREQKIRLDMMQKKARIAVLDTKIKQLKADIEELPKSHKDEVATLLRELDEIPKRQKAVAVQQEEKRRAYEAVIAERQAIEREIKPLEQQKMTLFQEEVRLTTELTEKQSHVDRVEHPNLQGRFRDKDGRWVDRKTVRPATPQELPGLKQDVARLRAEIDRLKAERAKVLAKIEERGRASTQVARLPKNEALSREIKEFSAQIFALHRQETDIKAKVVALVKADNVAFAARKAKTEELRRLETERDVMVRQAAPR